MPSFTNPNNLSIVTGAPPAVHGLPGNHYLAPDGEEVQLHEAAFLRAPSLHAGIAEAGAPVLAVTTKEKLRGCSPPAAFRRLGGARRTPRCPAGWPALPCRRQPPGIYDWDASHYALELGLALAAAAAVLLYVSLTDYVQHAERAGRRSATTTWSRSTSSSGVPRRRLALGLVADHGMNAKPAPRHAERALPRRRARGGRIAAHVVLPITDPYVVPPRRPGLLLLGARRPVRARATRAATARGARRESRR